MDAEGCPVRQHCRAQCKCVLKAYFYVTVKSAAVGFVLRTAKSLTMMRRLCLWNVVSEKLAEKSEL